MNLYQVSVPTSLSAQRSTPVYLYKQIDRQTERSIQGYPNGSSTAIKNRMQELDEE